MSGRANLSRYGGPNAPINRGIQDIDLFGNKRVIGGPTMGADGNVVYSPYKPAVSGFFGRAARAKADTMNQQILTEIMLQQMQAAQEKARVEETGEQQRETFTKQQVLDIMKQKGIPYTEENFKKYNDALNKLNLIEDQLKNESLDTKRQQKVLENPDVTEAVIQGSKAKALAPAYENFQKSVVHTPSDTISTFDPGALDFSKAGELSPFGSRMGTTTGPMVEQGMVPAPTMDLGNGQTIPIGQPKPFRQVTPGNTRIPVNPEILKAASMQNAGVAPTQPQPAVNPVSSQDQDIQVEFGPEWDNFRRGLDPRLQMYLNQIMMGQ